MRRSTDRTPLARKRRLTSDMSTRQWCPAAADRAGQAEPERLCRIVQWSVTYAKRLAE